jgi:hypothetical protein
MNRRLVASFTLAVTSTACWRTHQLAAPAAPQRIVPEVLLGGAPAPGLGRVVLDVQDGPAVVERVQGASASGIAGSHVLSGSLEISRRVCVTPCVLDLPPGPQELRFTSVNDGERTSTGFVNIDDRPSAYRHALGTQRSRAWRGLVGWPLLILGTLLDIGLVSAMSSDDFEASGPNLVGAGVSVGLTVLGGWLVSGSVIEQQPGTGVQWRP